MASRRPGARPPAPPLLTAPMRWQLLTIVGASASFYLLLSVVPLYASALAHSPAVAGPATAALMLTTVVGELGAPVALARIDNRIGLAVGLLLMGMPAVLLTVVPSVPWVLALTAVRGLGFAATLVAGGAITVALLPAERRAQGLAVAGAASALPALIVLPLGAWAADRGGYTFVSAVAGLCALGAVAAVARLPRGTGGDGGAPGPSSRWAPGAAVMLPCAVFGVSAMGAGIVFTFLPLAVGPPRAGLAAVLLFLEPAAALVARLSAGRYGDGRRALPLLAPALGAAALGMLLTALYRSPWAALVGVALFGVGFGASQNITLTAMYQRAPRRAYGAITALWNFAYDGGMGAGAFGFGLLSGRTGYAWALAATAVVMAAMLPAAVRVERGTAPTLAGAPTPGRAPGS